MASLYPKKISGKTYWYLREMARVDGKPKMVSERYLGTAAEIAAAMESSQAAMLPERTRHLAFGDVAAAWEMLRDLGVAAIIDEVTGAGPAGPPLSAGTYLALAALNRLVAPCSKLAFADWWKTTAADRFTRIPAPALDHRRFWDAMHAVTLDQLEQISQAIAVRIVGLSGLDCSSVALDMTNFATFIDTGNEKAPVAQRGKAKQKRTDLRLVGLGLVVTRDGGIPLTWHAYPGDRPDVTQFPTMISQLRSQYQAITAAAGFPSGDDALDEAQVQRQELFGIVHDEHAPHIELEPACGLALPQVKRGARRHVQQARILALALDAIVAPGQRIGVVVRDMAVEVAVFLVLELPARSRPQRLRLVDILVLEGGRSLLLHAHGESEVIGIAAHQSAQPEGVDKLLGFRFQMQHHAGTALLARDGLDRELPVSARFPAYRRLSRGVGAAAEQLDPLGDDERGIEANAELPDQLGVLLLVPGKALEELGGAGFGDGPEVRDRFLAAHADAVVADRQGAGLGVGVDPDGQLAVRAKQRRIRQRQKEQLVVGIGSVGDQLSQEDLPVAIQGVDHQLQESAALGLKAYLLALARPVPPRRYSQSGGMGSNCYGFKSGGAACVCRLRPNRPSRPKSVAMIPR